MKLNDVFQQMSDFLVVSSKVHILTVSYGKFCHGKAEAVGADGTEAQLGERFVSLEDRRGSDANWVADLGTSRSG